MTVGTRLTIRSGSEAHALVSSSLSCKAEMRPAVRISIVVRLPPDGPAE
jgi:hypothetical protein